MLAVSPLGLKAFFTASISRTSPWVILRWVEMVDWLTPLVRSSSVSFVGVRATAGVLST